MDLWRLDRMLFNTADSNHGNSGGPLLNENGAVVAVHTGGKSRIIDGKHQRVSRAVIPPRFSEYEFIESLNGERKPANHSTESLALE